MGLADGNVGVAFALTIAAGIATTIGSLFVFCAHVANKRLLAVSLGASAGVMLYVSFVEIFTKKAVSGFRESGLSDSRSQLYATLCFFGGIGLTALLDQLVHAIAHLAHRRTERGRGAGEAGDGDEEGGRADSKETGRPNADGGEGGEMWSGCEGVGHTHTDKEDEETGPRDLGVVGGGDAAHGRSAPYPPICVCKAKVDILEPPNTQIAEREGSGRGAAGRGDSGGEAGGGGAQGGELRGHEEGVSGTTQSRRGKGALPQQADVEGRVREILQREFPDLLVLHVTCHFPTREVWLELEVAMEPGISVRDARSLAERIAATTTAGVPGAKQTRVFLDLLHRL